MMKFTMMYDAIDGILLLEFIEYYDLQATPNFIIFLENIRQ